MIETNQKGQNLAKGLDSILEKGQIDPTQEQSSQPDQDLHALLVQGSDDNPI